MKTASRRPDIRAGLLLSVARRTLWLTAKEVADRCGVDWSSLSNFETARYRLAWPTERRVLELLLAEFRSRGIESSFTENSSVEDLRVQLATAIIRFKACGLFAIARATEGGQEDVVESAVREGLYLYQGRAAARIAKLLTRAVET